MIRVLIVDDQPLIRHSLKTVLSGEDDMEVVGEACSGYRAVELATQLEPDVVVMDIRMAEGDGLAATAAVTAATGARVVVLSMFDLDEYVAEALRAGARGFLLKDSRPEVLVDGLRRIHAGERLFAPSILERFVGHYLDRGHPAGSPLPGLTPREVEVLVLVAKGYSNREICAALHISMGTAKAHVSSLLAKVQARDRTHLVIAAYENGLV